MTFFFSCVDRFRKKGKREEREYCQSESLFLSLSSSTAYRQKTKKKADRAIESKEKKKNEKTNKRVVCTLMEAALDGTSFGVDDAGAASVSSEAAAARRICCRLDDDLFSCVEKKREKKRQKKKR